jgi:hypothetical protein
MTSPELKADRITKPMQLLGAWLAGLILVDGSFLAAARFLDRPTWLPAVLVIASVINVPLFLGCLFLLQTRFRAEMQEDTFYLQYVQAKQKTTGPELLADIAALRRDTFQAGERTITLIEEVHRQTATFASELSRVASGLHASDTQSDLVALEASRAATARQLGTALRDIGWAQVKISVNDLLPTYAELVARFKEAGIPINETFGSDSTAPVPEITLLSVGPDVRADLFQEVLRVAEDAVDFIQAGGDRAITGEIIVGSYGYFKTTGRRPPIAPLTSSLRTRLASVEIVDRAARRDREDGQYPEQSYQTPMKAIAERKSRRFSRSQHLVHKRIGTHRRVQSFIVTTVHRGLTHRSRRQSARSLARRVAPWPAVPGRASRRLQFTPADCIVSRGSRRAALPLARGGRLRLSDRSLGRPLYNSRKHPVAFAASNSLSARGVITHPVGRRSPHWCSPIGTASTYAVRGLYSACG